MNPTTTILPRILLIDDNSEIHEDFQKILAPGGRQNRTLNDIEAEMFGDNAVQPGPVSFELSSALQGEQAYRMVQESLQEGRPYAMAFVDGRMPPGWDGVETIRRIWEVDRDLQIVICTAYADYSWKQIIDKLGQSDSLLILKKPFDNVEAIQLAHALTHKWRLNREARLKMETLNQLVSQRTADLEAANARLLDTNRRLEAASRAKSLFLAMMSHELRTPMNGVLGMAEILSQTPLNEEQRECIESIRFSGDSLLSIISDILDYSRSEAGQLTLEPEPFDLRGAVDQAVKILQPRVVEKGLTLGVVETTPLPTPLIGDPGRVRQILLNLIGNAVKFTETGSIEVRLLCEAETATHAAVRLEIQDTGIGVSPEAQAVLFQPFTQADLSLTRRHGGTGLGLAISQQLVALMKGEIGMRSAVGQGSTFWFNLRLEKPAAAAGTMEQRGSVAA